MEELQDAIEDARYVKAISTQVDGPRPLVTWDTPTEEELVIWKKMVQIKVDPLKPFGVEWTLSSGIGFFLFSVYLKDECNDYLRINFIEEVLRWQKLTGRYRVYKARSIVSKYLKSQILKEDSRNVENKQTNLPEKTEIHEYDLERPPPNLQMTEEEFQVLYDTNFDISSTNCCIGLDGPVRNSLLKVQGTFGWEGQYFSESSSFSRDLPTKSLRDCLRNENSMYLSDKFFDLPNAIIVESLRKDYWDGFLESEQYTRLLSLLWYQDRRVIPDDFYTMRVLGRGGFGLVTACKKGTSGKLYAMKIMNKRRIKMKKSEALALNERNSLASVESPFVVNLKYSFQSKDDVFLILDLMTGGDLGFHLHQKRSFPKEECLYYAARIMLGLQALHDRQYVYRDLKPGNCLLAADGRVKLTDLGLATKITPTLHGAAGTRGYWAPEMLQRDRKGKRMPYGHAVDWFSFGCCVAEFLSGKNPFRSETALKFGMGRGYQTKEKAIDCATLEMNPEFDPKKFDDDSADLCRRLLDKNEKTRLGINGCDEIMEHPCFKDLEWELIMSDRKKPPFIPAKDINAASQSEIGNFEEDERYQETVITEKDEEVYKYWDSTNRRAFATEVIEFLIYEREIGEPLVPIDQNPTCCCALL